MPVSATVTRVLVVSAKCQRALVVSGTVRKGVFKRTSYTLNLLDQDVVTFVSALIHNRQLSVQDRDAMGVVSGLVKNATLLLVDADALSMQSGVVINGQLSLQEHDVLSLASRLIHNSTLTLSDRDTVTFTSGLAGGEKLELADTDAVTFESAKVFNAALTLTDRDGLSGQSHVVHNAALLLADVDVLTSAGGLIYNSTVQLADGDLLTLVGGLVRNRSLVLVDADSVVFASEVVDGGGGSNPYYDENADFYYELSDAMDSNGGAHLTLTNMPSFANDGVFGKCMTLNGTSQFAYDNGDMVVPYIAARGYSVRVRMLVSFSNTGNRCPIAFNGTNWCFFIRDTGVYEMRWRVVTPSAFSGSGFWSSITLGQVYELVLEWGYYYENGAYKGCRAYLDGNLLGSSTGNTVGSADLVYPFFLGQFGNSPFYYFAGTIDEVAITTPCVPPV